MTTPPQRATTLVGMLCEIRRSMATRRVPAICADDLLDLDACIVAARRLPAAAERSELCRLADALHARGLSLGEIVAIARGEKK